MTIETRPQPRTLEMIATNAGGPPPDGDEIDTLLLERLAVG